MSEILRFGLYEVDRHSGEVRKRGVPVKVRHQSFQILDALLEHPGKVVSRDDLRERLWGDDVIVDFENNLNTAIAQLRQALCDSSERPRYIETVPKRGYRFVAEISARVTERENARTRSRLVVLPFINMTGDGSQEYFSDAVTDEVINALAGLAPEYLAVIARTTAMHYKGSRKDVARIARELNVDYVVEGGVFRADNHVSVNVQLISTRDEAHLYSRKFETDIAEVFGLYASIADELAQHLPSLRDRKPDFKRSHGQSAKPPTRDIGAYNEYIQGRFQMMKWTPDGIARAKAHFEAALARDPLFALACDALAELYWYLGFWGFVPSKESDRIGRLYVLRALELDPTLAETHALLSCYPKQITEDQQLRYFDWPVQQRDATHARKLNPESPQVRLRYAIIEMVLGHTEEAAAELEGALEVDPLSPDLRAWLSEMLCLGHHYERALDEAQKLIELHPENPMAHSILGFVHLARKEYDDAETALRRSVELSGGRIPLPVGWLGLSLGLNGRMVEARAVLEDLRSIAKERFVPPTCFAWVHLGLGEVDEAFVWMDRAVDTPDRMMAAIKTYPFLDPIRDDPRFAALLRKMNL